MTCHCGQPATRTLAAVSYCEGCLQAVLRPIRARVAKRYGIGFGEQHGPLRPDWGQGWADLQCSVCEATWVGPIGEPCTWCVDALENMQRWQAEMLLDPDLPDPDDAGYEGSFLAWADRLGRAVQVKLITAEQATSAIERQGRHVT